MLGLVGLAVALGAYPVMRRLTLRLEALQRGVERWGAGDLSARINTEGHDEVAFLARRFNHAAERIETLMDSHKSLLANASHELRSPLARIRMGLELMGADIASPQRMEISRSITELDQLIDEILLASRLDTKQADAEPFETLDLTGLAPDECARVNDDLNAELPGGHSLVVQGSPRLLRRLIRNLLENARRYGRGDISLELAHLDAGGKPFAVIRVLDRGPGVPADKRERIFEPFYRLPGASEREGGVGLGLSLVKSISERHGGSVRCEDRPGGGAAFIGELPMTAQNT
jgi:signal transduction histidine kinase